MDAIQTHHDVLCFEKTPELPEIDLQFVGCRTAEERQFYDIIDFARRRIDRWSIPLPMFPRAVEAIRESIPELPYGYTSHEQYYVDHYMVPHTAQLSLGGKLFVGYGGAENGFFVNIIDTVSGAGYVYPGDQSDPLMLYSSTGDFSADHRYWYFVRWPFAGRSKMRRCEIGAIDTDTLESEIRWSDMGGNGLALPGSFHQVTCSSDGRQAAIAPFDFELNIPYPAVPYEEDPEGYRRSLSGGIKLESVVTVDLASGRASQLEIPVPVPAHLEFHPTQPHVVYASAHNISYDTAGTMLEGKASLFRLELDKGTAEITGCYTDDRFYRITQHSIFDREGRTLMAVTCVPNQLVILDADTMELWRRVELFPAEPIQFSGEAHALCPNDPRSCFSVNPSKDGRHIVLEDASNFIIYDVDEDRMLDLVVPRHLPQGSCGRGHTRIAGQ